MSDMIVLDVGGRRFKTTLTTLTRFPNSTLAKMFQKDSGVAPASINSEGEYFLDSDPETFSVILNWLRYNSLILGNVNPEDVLPVADFFALDEMQDQLKVRIKENRSNTNNVPSWSNNEQYGYGRMPPTGTQHVVISDPNRLVPVQITIPAQQGNPASQPRALTVQVPAHALQQGGSSGSTLQQVLTQAITQVELSMIKVCA